MCFREKKIIPARNSQTTTYTLWMVNLEDFKTREELQHSIPAAFAKDLFICGNGFLHTSLSASHVEKIKYRNTRPLFHLKQKFRDHLW